MRRIKKRHAAVGLFMTGLMTVGAGMALENTAGADPVFDETQFDLHLKDSQHNSTWSGSREGNCDAGLAPQGFPYGWHFVVPDYSADKGSLPDIASVQVAFSGGGSVDTGHVVQRGKGWYVFTSLPGTLVDAVGDSTATHDPAIEMVLSHTCGPTGQSSSSSSQVSSSSSEVSSSSVSSSSEESSSSVSSSSESSSVSSSSTSRTTSSQQTSSSQVSSSEESSSSESSPSVSGSSLSNPSDSSSAAVVPVSSGPQVKGVQVPAALPQTGIDPGFLLMLGGMLVISGVVLMRYSSDQT